VTDHIDLAADLATVAWRAGELASRLIRSTPTDDEYQDVADLLSETAQALRQALADHQ
jgi:hypothetical protein